MASGPTFSPPSLTLSLSGLYVKVLASPFLRSTVRLSLSGRMLVTVPFNPYQLGAACFVFSSPLYWSFCAVCAPWEPLDWLFCCPCCSSPPQPTNSSDPAIKPTASKYVKNLTRTDNAPCSQG